MLTRTYKALLAILDTGGADMRWNFPYATKTPVVVTYSFPETNELPGLWADGNPMGSSGYHSFSQVERQNFRDAAAVWAAVAGVTFVEVEGPAMIEAFGSDGSEYAGWANYPYPTQYGGRGILVVDGYTGLDEGSYGFLVLLHELGHALGLKHPFEGDITLAADVDNLAHTVMTYNNYVASGIYPDTLGSLDLRAIQVLYGRPQDTSGWSFQTDETFFQITASEGADVVAALPQRTLIDGGDGDDTILGGHFRDRLNGGEGNDSILGGDGRDEIYGGDGDDTLWTSAGPVARFGFNEIVYGGAGNDRIHGRGRLSGDDGDDRIWGSDSADTLKGGDGDDTLISGNGPDKSYGGGGNDMFVAGALSGGEVSGIHEFYGGSGRDTVDYSLSSKGARADMLHPPTWTDSLVSVEKVIGSAFDDKVAAGNQAEDLRGGEGDDQLHGRGGNDLLLGEEGRDKLYGGDGNDRLYGGDGNDLVFGGAGLDRMTGGLGADRFIFTNPLDSTNATADRILDFLPGTDRIEFRTAIFADMSLQIGGSFTADGPSLVTQGWKGNTIVNVDRYGDGHSDMRIVLVGVETVTEADFLV